MNVPCSRGDAPGHADRGVDGEHQRAALPDKKRCAAAARTDIEAAQTRSDRQRVERVRCEGVGQRLEDHLVQRNVIVPADGLLVRLKVRG
jgi:hypothetical protein